MCEECGCGTPRPFEVRPMRSKGPPVEGEGGAGHGDGHWHTRSDGTRYWHAHGREGIGAHSHGGGDGLPPAGHPREGETATRSEGGRMVEVQQAVLGRNARLAERNRGYLHALGIRAVNVMSSPGAGKTSLLEHTIRGLGKRAPVAVVVGDLATARDAERLNAAGGRVVQITTGSVCHLDAEMVARGIAELDLTGCGLLLLENVGNLVCPADFDLGESGRAVLLSVTEGEDKPLKYPPIFRAADVVVLSKIDLAEVCGIDLPQLRENVRAVVRPGTPVLEVSVRTGLGLRDWFDWLGGGVERARG